MKIFSLIFRITFFIVPGAFCKSQDIVIPLYPGDIPGAKIIPATYVEQHDTSRGYFTNVSNPTLTVYTPEKGKATGTAVIIIPGGGYRVLVDEGAYFAKAFTDQGITAFALKYRLPADEIMYDKSMTPLQDLQMAMKFVRQHAANYNINPGRIGFIGLSAGGHIASTQATHLNTVLIENKENINLRPDFLILVYPVISFKQYPVAGTVTRLLGPAPKEDSLQYFSNELHVDSTTAPAFLVHAADDDRVAVQHSLLFFEALHKAQVAAELHILPNGGHAFALEHPTREAKWFSWCIDWLNDMGYGPKPRNQQQETGK